MGRYFGFVTCHFLANNCGMLSGQSSDGKRHLENIEKKFSFSGKLNMVGKIDKLPDFRYRWNTNEVRTLSLIDVTF